MRSILHRVPGIAHKFLDRVACRFRSCGPCSLALHTPASVKATSAKALPNPAEWPSSNGWGQVIDRCHSVDRTALARVAKQGIPSGNGNFREAKRGIFERLPTRGTEGSSPSPSSGASPANLTFSSGASHGRSQRLRSSLRYRPSIAFAALKGGKLSSHLTHRWTELDSNSRSRYESQRRTQSGLNIIPFWRLLEVRQAMCAEERSCRRGHFD
jgi:hypothetical protein